MNQPRKNAEFTKEIPSVLFAPFRGKSGIRELARHHLRPARHDEP